MAYYPFAPETGAIYDLANPANGAVAVFNDPLDPNYAGMLTAIDGLDSPEVRESAEELVQADGGTHGYFYFGRRPIVLSASVFGHSSILERNLRVDRADRASQLLRNDGTLSWKPSTRQENLVWNPKAAVDLSNHSTSVSTGLTETRVTANLPTGWTTGFQITGTATSTIPAAGQAGWSGSGVGGIPVYPGQKISGGFVAKVVSLTSGTMSAMNIRVNWYKADGTSSSVASFSTLASQSNPVVGTTYTLEGTATAPSDAAYATLRPVWGTSNPVTFTATYSGFKFSPTTGTVIQPYIDGDTAGYYWNGNANGSISGDYIEMFTPVRRNSVFRQTGGWVKELNIPLVSEYATVQSTSLKSQSAAGGVSMNLENQGSWPAYPILQITGITASNPVVKNTTPAPDLEFKTTGGLIVASGETLEVDTLNHTAYFTAGARNGQSANRYIDFANTTWPAMATGNNVFTLTGTGTLTVLWRDTWV